MSSELSMLKGAMLKEDKLKVFLQCYLGLWTDESQLKGQNFHPRTTDIFIAGSQKSSLTWLQWIIHRLSTCGDIDFEGTAMLS